MYKKLKNLLVLAVVSSALLALGSCDDDIEDNGLMVTAWALARSGSFEDGSGDVHSSIETFTILFKTTSTGRMQYSFLVPDMQEANEHKAFDFTYTYTPPTGLITEDGDGEDAIAVPFTVVDDTMTISLAGREYSLRKM